jgi:hypothetical protein
VQQQPAQPQQPQQQQQQRHAHFSEDELAAAVGAPSEWETGWTSSDYTQHPKVGDSGLKRCHMPPHQIDGCLGCRKRQSLAGRW